MRSLQYLKIQYEVRRFVDKQISKSKTLYELREDHRINRKLKAEFALGFDGSASGAKQTDSVDLARGFRYVLRNSLDQPITKITLGDCDEPGESVTIWEREEDDTPGEIVLAQAYRTKYGDPARYVMAA